MSYKSNLSNSIKSNSEPPLWVKSQAATVETNVKLAGDEAKDRLYEPKHKKKLVRVLTVIAYIISVSLAAIMLSLYYIFIWNPQSKPKLAGEVASLAKIRNNCPDLMNQEALAQIKADVSMITPQPTDLEQIPSWQTTTEDSVESIYDEASSETKIDENNNLNIENNMENSLINYESENINLSNETVYK